MHALSVLVLHSSHPHSLSPPTPLSLHPLFRSPAAHYFDIGNSTWRTPVSGLTHFERAPVTKFSAYRFHETDPIVFSEGARMDWRNGDMDDPTTGQKCFTQSGGRVVGSPGVAQAQSYAWVYVWPTGTGMA